MSKAKFAAAKEMIDEKQYDQARVILKGIDHPTARAWEAKLDKLAPKSNKTNIGLVFALTAVVTVVIVVFAVILSRNNTSQTTIAALPTMFSLPTATATTTPTITPTLTITYTASPSPTYTATPTITLTRTPTPSATSTQKPLPTKPPEPTPAPVAGCWYNDVMSWMNTTSETTRQTQEYLNDVLLTQTAESLKNALNNLRETYTMSRLIPYSECMVTTRAFYLKILESEISQFENLLKGDSTAAEKDFELVQLYVQQYTSELQYVIDYKFQLEGS